MKTLLKNGYILIKSIGHPKADKWGWVKEHRVVMEQKIGRLIADDEHIHHIDGNKSNNHPDNLIIVKPEEHSKLHKECRRQKVYSDKKFYGVSKRKNRASPYRAMLCIDGIKYQTKSFKSEEEAARAYDDLVKKYYPDGKLNFPEL